MWRAVERERTDNGRFAAGNSLTLEAHSPLQERTSDSGWDRPTLATSPRQTSAGIVPRSELVAA